MIHPYFRGEACDLKGEVHLLLDDFAIEDRWDAERRQNVPLKHPGNPVVAPDLPWEVRIGAPAVLYDPEAKLFRMWYALYNTAAWTRWATGLEVAKREYSPYILSYAQSPDGIHWEKPLFKKHPFREFDDTNIVYTGNPRCSGFNVKFSPEPVAKYGRFMLVYKDDVQERGFAQKELNDYACAGHVCLAFSDDGIEWRPYEKNPVHPALDNPHPLLWDERIGHWIMGGRPIARAATEDLYREIGGRIKGGESLRTSIANITGDFGDVGLAGARENVRTRVTIALSPDLETWYPPREVLCPDAGDDEEQIFFDQISMERYGNQYLGFLGVQSRDGTGIAYVEMVGSPDGMSWHRPRKKEPFLTPGEEGAWDGGAVWFIKNIVPYGSWLYMYYMGNSRRQRYRFPENMRALGLARIQRDRFAGYYGDVNGGYVITKEVKVTAPKLLVNCSVEHRAFSRDWHGSVHTELVERTGRAIGGYTFRDCDPNHVDDLAHEITWKKKDVSALIGQNVYVRFYLRNAYVFAFRFGS